MSRSPRRSASALALATVALLEACGGSSRHSFDAHGSLLEVTLSDPAGQLTLSQVKPSMRWTWLEASLVQQVVFVFDTRPDPRRIGPLTLPILDPIGNVVPGTYDVVSNRVTFTPRLPLAPVGSTATPGLPGGGAALLPGLTYTVRVSPTVFAFVLGVEPALRSLFPDPADPGGISIPFTTSTIDARMLSGLPADEPILVAADPADGAAGITPELYGDPERRFAARRVFTLTFDAPLHPGADDTAFRLLDLDERAPDGQPLVLGSNVRLLENSLPRSVVEVMPSGILPFGHLLALEIPALARGLSAPPDPAAARRIAASFTIADAGQEVVVDLLEEGFDDDSRENRDGMQLDLGNVPAEWDRLDSGILQASHALISGDLGRFAPASPKDPAKPTILVLDTSSQVLPLYDGSTPDALPGAVVKGGIFAFSEIDIPVGVIVEGRGPNPLVLTATGSVHIAGTLRCDGAKGVSDFTFDHGYLSNAGGEAGAGGGRGGEGHPIVYDGSNNTGIVNYVSPVAGGAGFGPGNRSRGGATGGATGVLDRADVNGQYTTLFELDCNTLSNSNSNGGKVPGGGGASFLRAGASGKDGRANVLADGVGGYVVRTPGTHGSDFDRLSAGVPNAAPFVNADAQDDFIGIRGELHVLQGGYGGGAGGSRLESYYCGGWCKKNTNPLDDGNCLNNVFFLTGMNFADSVVDARGGGGGGGGGALVVRAWGPIVIAAGATVSARGGDGGGGEAIGCSYWGGAGGGGSGGVVWLDSHDSILVEAIGFVDVSGGIGSPASRTDNYFDCNTDPRFLGSGGDGSPGLVQLTVPAGKTATVVNPGASILPLESWTDSDNALNPSAFGDTSVALSTWFDLGRVIARLPAGTRPSFDFLVGGSPVGAGDDGFVKTDGSGFVVAPAATDIVCDFLGQHDVAGRDYLPGQEPRPDFIPQNAAIRVEFQAADAVAPGSKEVDPATIGPWSPTPSLADGHQFLRWRVTFNVAVRPEDHDDPDPALPTVAALRVRARY